MNQECASIQQIIILKVKVKSNDILKIYTGLETLPICACGDPKRNDFGGNFENI